MTDQTAAVPAGKKTKNKSAIQRRLIPTYIFLAIVSFFSVFPLYWMITAATNKSLEVAQGKIWFGTNLAENFKNLTGTEPLWTSMGNSFLYAVVQTLLCLFICSLAGYGFELYHDKVKDKLFAVLLLGMMIPQVATMIPLFRMISAGNLLNTVWGFILPTISTPFMIMMFRQNSRNFPIDIMEAARIDGLGEFQIFFRMYMPVYEIYLCGSCGHYIHERMERVSVAEGCHDQKRSTDHADADCESGKRLYDRLWRADARCTFLLYSYDDHLLRTAETVCGRYYRCR